MEVFYGLDGESLDLIIHSPGGQLEAAEAFVKYMRSKFRHVRAVIPSVAMSAATMIACACDEVLMGKHSFLGPTDPQLLLPWQFGYRQVAAQAIIEQFRKAQEECAESPAKLSAWLPSLSIYGPDLLVTCEQVLHLSKRLVNEWLQRYMLAERDDKEKLAESIAEKLSKHDEQLTHGRHLDRDTLEKMGLRIVRMEQNEEERDAFLSVFHATTHTFSGTSAVKIIENHEGKAFIKSAQMFLPMPSVPPSQPPAPRLS
jgi:hypothetical protein